jgi:hypothetical protein
MVEEPINICVPNWICIYGAYYYKEYILYVIQLSDRVYNVDIPAWNMTWHIFDVIEEWRQRYGNGHLQKRKMKIKEANVFNTVGCCILKKSLNP